MTLDDDHWATVFLIFIIAVAMALGSTLVYLGVHSENIRMEFNRKCVDAGGYPVSPMTYVKGQGDANYLCIHPNAIIELDSK